MINKPEDSLAIDLSTGNSDAIADWGSIHVPARHERGRGSVHTPFSSVGEVTQERDKPWSCTPFE